MVDEKRVWMNWLEQAEADLDKAKVLFRSENFDGVIFYSQQSIEKGLKALMLKGGEKLVKTHNLIKLGRDVDLPENFSEDIKRLNEGYLNSRYDMMSEVIPARRYSSEDGDIFIKLVLEVLKWIKRKV